MLTPSSAEQVGDERGPAGLVRGTEALAGVAVEVLAERDVLLPQGIVGRLDARAVARSRAVRTAAEERDQAIVNDERSHAVRGDAACWGIAALILIGSAMMVARLWIRLEAGMAIYGLVNGALFVAVCRWGWLNRAEPAEDE